MMDTLRNDELPAVAGGCTWYPGLGPDWLTFVREYQRLRDLLGPPTAEEYGAA